MIQSRTDLALELKEEWAEGERLKGVSIKEFENIENGIKKTVITIENEEGEQQVGKPIGTYITLESREFLEETISYQEGMSEVLHDVLKEWIGDNHHILVAGLGNREVTPDALGPYVVDHLFVTRHLKEIDMIKGGLTLSAIVPGVMAQTGMESCEILKGIVDVIQPDYLVVIDALCARNFKRLNKTIQISNTGIAPGSGVGNHRKAITEETIGIPVIAIGVPTVISVPAIVSESMQRMIFALQQVGFKAETTPLEEEEAYQLALETVEPKYQSFVVTPKNIDEAVRKISFTISEAINGYITVPKGI